MTKTDLRKRLLDEDNRLTVKQNGRLDAVQKVFDKMYEVLKKTEYDLLKNFLTVEGRLQQVEEILSWEDVRDNR